jgi:hypothetical protein
MSLFRLRADARRGDEHAGRCQQRAFLVKLASASPAPSMGQSKWVET